ncbi:MAG: PD-(D/E)XK nuclease family protein [Gammaproteobacteria bacterium]|nr:PD-(D/E)XK nuclease family protein [Gammaproteobacteria bacterium]
MSNLENLRALRDSEIVLREEDHVYVFPDGSEICDSVTDIVERQWPPFNKDVIAKSLTRNSLAYQHLTAEELIEEWEATADHGSLVHKELAEYVEFGKEPAEKKSVIGKRWLDHNTDSDSYFLCAELKVYGKSVQLAGQIDLVVVDKITDNCFIFDWKTGKIEEPGKGRKAVTMVCSDLKGKHDQYSLQMSFYAHLLKEHGVTVKAQYIIHLMENRATVSEAKNCMEIVEKIIDSQFE